MRTMGILWRFDPPRILIDKGYEIFCGFDNDETGDILANKMIRFSPTVKRLRPTKHDWNEILVSKYIIS